MDQPDNAIVTVCASRFARSCTNRANYALQVIQMLDAPFGVKIKDSSLFYKGFHMADSKLKITVLIIVPLFLSSCLNERTRYELPTSEKYSHYFYLSLEYIQYLETTKSHPEAVNLIKNNNPIIFYYQNNDGKYHESNLHEGGPSVEI